MTIEMNTRASRGGSTLDAAIHSCLRIGYLVGVSQILGWERANKLGRYGKVAIVDGRQAVSLTAIERAENKSYSSEQIEAALTRPPDVTSLTFTS